MMEIKCCICGTQLENQSSYDYYCESCQEKYGDYEEDIPSIQPMRKRKKYDDDK
jgi:hypothetical protein